jgi:hypothetical protein
VLGAVSVPALAALLLALRAATAGASQPPPAAAPPIEPEVAALRALARVAAADPDVEEVQRAAADGAGADPDRLGWSVRTRSAAWLPTLTLQASRAQRDTRVVGVTGTVESDYVRYTPSLELGVRAAWDLDRLVFARDETDAAWTAAKLRERRDERLRHATRLYYQRRRLLVQLALEPPREPLARAERENQVREITAELDALTGGLLSGRRRSP